MHPNAKKEINFQILCQLLDARKYKFPSFFSTILKTLSGLGLHIERLLKIGEKLGS